MSYLSARSVVTSFDVLFPKLSIPAVRSGVKYAGLGANVRRLFSFFVSGSNRLQRSGVAPT